MASKKTPEINGGSMADISFLMLIFFLMVTTMDAETGLSRRLPPMPSEDQQVQDLKVNRRNILDVKINSKDGVMAGGEVILSDAQLEEIVIEFLTNPTDSEKLPSKKVEDIEGFGEYPVSEGIISLQNDRSSSYKKYVEIQNVLVKALNTIRDQFARSNFGKVYNELDADQQEIVRKAIPNRISESEPKDVSKK
ncbi:MAG: biopolymer transporter ExbD [Bacteroidales bacterium]|jgi:biopolymer transport protein ExbD|nr:biopolymer transporter ExbD [Bacteroidales bacterium]MBO7256724.1 biopolymer transporter ExbD [Bacteroidales bacterium]MBO7284536.1 biopolymer transporter ExbD [Bacteroidales bacterium]MBO7323623.1 biopolymer transporter ExbD [Bacteroidales bacterium]MBQ5747503.1 biopolymer transporter ExbD [Bacteroidales bacterium]